MCEALSLDATGRKNEKVKDIAAELKNNITSVVQNLPEKSKEAFRQLLLNHFEDADILLNKSRMEERFALARENKLPVEVLMQVSDTYLGIAEKVIGRKVQVSDHPKAEIIEVLQSQYDLIV